MHRAALKVRWLTPIVSQSDNTIALTAVGLSTGTLAPVAGTAHHHAAKKTHKIGEGYPTTGYGTSCAPNILESNLLSACTDSFYLLSRDVPVIPTRLAAGSAPNVIKSIVDTPVAAPLATLASDKSGLKVTFDSNRTSLRTLVTCE